MSLIDHAACNLFLDSFPPVDFRAAVDLSDGRTSGDEDEVEEPAVPVEEAHDAEAAVRVRVVAVLGSHALELVLVLRRSLELLDKFKTEITELARSRTLNKIGCEG